MTVPGPDSSGRPRESWFDDEAGPLVRLYAVARGRGRTARPELNMLTLVVDAGRGAALRRTEPEYAAIVRLCRTPQSVAEVSAQLKLPLTITKVLIGDLIEDGRLDFRSPDPAQPGVGDVGLLQQILNGIRAL
ncbi:DUF742 domain-containing protein [Nocardia terpenica]|uniref:DUF742 domain-containing protein n=1 Tax=Nocardia terpenica TaxID=455432 RepID=A0A291RT09_9NOCA|nr:DUF742 domain-containing protein [Nocardia terpenica]ATL70378.1 hypothetical protein CRH09_33550 [Nocardia terpenica]QIS22544.1 DUF742 domain-containing protein [Nocardia terpenica]